MPFDTHDAKHLPLFDAGGSSAISDDDDTKDDKYDAQFKGRQGHARKQKKKRGNKRNVGWNSVKIIVFPGDARSLSEAYSLRLRLCSSLLELSLSLSISPLSTALSACCLAAASAPSAFDLCSSESQQQ